ncbi:MAG TPA: GNAT family N-acetyltransferase [Nitrospira sp.]|nr:GNAT family N-acetyltransferase [Nitrospira sp.]
MHIEVITEYSKFLALGPVWNKLLERSGIDHPFLTHEWISVWWECFGEAATPYILTVVSGDDIIAIAPLMLNRGRLYGCPIRRLQAMVNVYTERFDLLLGERPQEACLLIWAYLKDHAHEWDVLELRQLPGDARALEYLPPLVEKDGYRVGLWSANDAPYVAIRQPWEAYYQSLKKAHRSNVRNHTRQLERQGPVTLDVVAIDDRWEADMEDALKLEAVTWKVDEGTSLRSRQESALFYRRMLQRATQLGWLHMCFLKVGSARIAVRISLLYRNKLFMLKSGYDEAYHRYSPGQVLTERLLREAWEKKWDEIDFLGNEERWKLCWATGRRPHAWLFAFPNRLKSRLLHGMKFRVIPGIRQSNLFPSVRRTMMKLGVPIHGD